MAGGTSGSTTGDGCGKGMGSGITCGRGIVAQPPARTRQTT
jgi:hypothetical protein